MAGSRPTRSLEIKFWGIHFLEIYQLLFRGQRKVWPRLDALLPDRDGRADRHRGRTAGGQTSGIQVGLFADYQTFFCEFSVILFKS